MRSQPTILVNRTFATVTPESAELGDFADSGFDFENQEYTFRELVELMENHPEPSSAPCIDPGMNDWFTSYPETCYRTGEETSYSIHFSRKNPTRMEKYWTKAAIMAGVARRK